MLSKYQDQAMSQKPSTRARNSNRHAANDSHTTASHKATYANASFNIDLTRDDLKGMLDAMTDEILSKLWSTVTTLQPTVSSQVVKIQEMEYN